MTRWGANASAPTRMTGLVHPWHFSFLRLPTVKEEVLPPRLALPTIHHISPYCRELRFAVVGNDHDDEKFPIDFLDVDEVIEYEVEVFSRICWLVCCGSFGRWSITRRQLPNALILD